MKKLIPIILVLSLFISACQLGGGPVSGMPTPLAFSTAVPSPTSIPTGESISIEDGSTGTERTSAGDGMVQVFIPAGTFVMGGIDAKAASDEKPIHQVTMNAFWFDKVEVTNGMYAICVQAGACKVPIEFKSESRQLYYSRAEFNDYPVVYVTWYQAKSYCEWAGRRLPTEAEWEHAARGDDTRIYPWGDQFPDAQRANFNRYFGDTTRVGNFPTGASPFGIMDMSGNVGEWVNDFYGAKYYDFGVNFNPPGPAASSLSFNRVVRGGNFLDPDVSIRVSKRSSVLGSNLNAQLDSPEWLGKYSPRIGFRCASNN